MAILQPKDLGNHPLDIDAIDAADATDVCLNVDDNLIKDINNEDEDIHNQD